MHAARHPGKIGVRWWQEAKKRARTMSYVISARTTRHFFLSSVIGTVARLVFTDIPECEESQKASVDFQLDG
jgi:hypothetical protein